MSGGLEPAIRAARARKGQPTEDDRPPPSTLPGRQPRPRRGQIDLFGGEIHSSPQSPTMISTTR